MMIPNPMRMIVKMMMIKTKTKNIFINEKILNLYFIKKIYHDKKHYFNKNTKKYAQQYIIKT